MRKFSYIPVVRKEIMSIQKIQQKYRGINPSDLDFLNPEYSCVICKNLPICNKKAYTGKTFDNNSGIAFGDQKPGKGNSCGDCEPMTEQEFANIYDFGS
jgi:hypothetical protein